MKRDGIASWTTFIQSENKISKNSQLEGKVNKLIWTFYSTVEPCFNKPSYNKVLGIINNIPSPSTIIVKYMEKKLYVQNLIMANIFIVSPLTLHYIWGSTVT